MPHGYQRSTGEFQLIDNGVSISRYYGQYSGASESNTQWGPIAILCNNMFLLRLSVS